jgi:hypothetical protein
MYVEANRRWNEGPYDPPTVMHTPVHSLRLDLKLWAILRGLGVINMCVFHFFKSLFLRKCRRWELACFDIGTVIVR